MLGADVQVSTIGVFLFGITYLINAPGALTLRA